ncbi:hypothetical protein BaRGS_00017135 [Batillaria attramentaria]|uniref:Uncharacterized protein n=1 Tax=Batillaria attramentaria TaxID=370345 RepID=A0ABD0KY21_9CAEN
MSTKDEDADTSPLLSENSPTSSEDPEIGTTKLSIQNTQKMALPRRKLLRCAKVLAAVAILVVTIAFVKMHYSGGHQGVLGFRVFATSYKIGDNVEYNLRNRLLTFSDEAFNKILSVEILDEHVASDADLDSCEAILGVPSKEEKKGRTKDLDKYLNTVCLRWKDKAQLILRQSRTKGSDCYSVNWTAVSNQDTLENCVQLDGAYWYGGSVLDGDHWPLEDASIPMQPFTSSPLGAFTRDLGRKSYGPVLERMWINSAGFGIVVDSAVPLHVSVNADGDTLLCLRAKYGRSRYKPSSEPLSLNYSVCMDRTAKQVHRHILENFLTLPHVPPHDQLLRDPVWSTRGINMYNLTERQVFTLQTAVKAHKLPHSQFHISGNLTHTLGGLYFDWARFPHAHQMMSEIAEHGFNVSTTVFPFLEMGAADYEEGKQIGAFLTVQNKQVAGLSVSNKTVALIDFTNPEACDWFTKRLETFRKETGIRAFHFHSGEAISLSTGRETTVPLLNPSDYSTYYAKFAHSFGDGTIVSAAYQSQQFGLMVDIGARLSNWGYNLGLKSIIPSVLTLGLLGYPFLLVGPVGGVPLPDSFNRTANALTLPDRELYIRWLQLSIFLPAFEISVGPWQYDAEVETIANNLLKLRTEFIYPILQTATKEFLHTGAPIIRPLWWMASDDKTAQRIDCEFLVSNKLLVSPVLDEGARERSVYLPKVGSVKWRDESRNKVYTGGQWLHNYAVDLKDVAFFIAE